MLKKTMTAIAVSSLFVGVAMAAPQTVVTVETVAPAPATEPAPAVVATVDVPMVKDLNTPAKKVESNAAQGCTDGDDCIKQTYQAFMRKNGWPMSGKDAKGKSFYFGSASVDVSRTNADYGKYLSLAYTQAYMKAVNTFSRKINVDVQNEVLTKAFLDASTNARDFPTLTEEGGRSDIEALWLKVSKFTQARLDKGLRELGVDPKQFDAVDPDQKKKIFEDALTNKTIERTSIALGGINVVGNFVHEGETSQVGVVIAYSPSIEGLAQSLRMGKKPAIQAVGQPLDVQIPLDGKVLMDMYGPRLMIDENGPAIVSFAFWSPEPAPTPQLRSRYRELAMNQARSEATAQIARFLMLSYSANSEAIKGKASSIDAVKSGKDGSVTDKIANAITDITSEDSIARTSATLTGLNTVREWKANLDSGTELVGAVMSYSFADIQYVKSITGQQATQEATPSQPQQPVDFGTSTRESTIKSSIDVF